MWSWLKGLFHREPKQPEPPRMIDVGKVIVDVMENDGTSHRVTLKGRYIFSSDYYGDYFDSGWDVFTTWQDACGRTGTASVGDGTYIPVCNIKSIKTRYVHHEVEAK